MFLVIGGCYSDWHIEGYFNNREDAEKYVLGEDCGLYVEEVKHLSLKDGMKDIKVRKEHKIVFDFREGLFKAKMRNEPDRYEIFEGENKVRSITRGCWWLSFTITHDDRSVAEKIAQDKINEIAYIFSEINGETVEDLDKAIELVKGDYEVRFRK